MKQKSLINLPKKFSTKKILPILFVLFAMAWGENNIQDTSDMYLIAINSAHSLENVDTGIDWQLGNIGTSNNTYSFLSGKSGYSSETNSSSSIDLTRNSPQRRKYGIMSAVFGTLSATSVVLMVVGDWEKTTTGNSVRINATDGASVTGLIMSLVSFPMAIYSLIRFGLSPKYEYSSISPRVQPVIICNFREKNIGTKLNINF